MFGVAYEGKTKGLAYAWIHALQEYEPCPQDADEDTIVRHYEVYLYCLFSGIMFCHTAGDYVVPELVWLARELAERPGDAFPYSWGSAVLAATYRGLAFRNDQQPDRMPPPPSNVELGVLSGVSATHWYSVLPRG